MAHATYRSLGTNFLGFSEGVSYRAYTHKMGSRLILENNACVTFTHLCLITAAVRLDWALR